MSATPPPPATGQRVPWTDLPIGLRTRIDERLGSPVRTATTQPGGFSPGVAARLELEDGRRAFVKAAHPAANPITPDVHRREARIVAALPADAPVPKLLWVIDDGPEDWVVLAFDDIDGHLPTVPWRRDELAVVLEAMTELARDLTPSPLGRDLVGDASDMFDPAGDGWASIADAVHRISIAGRGNTSTDSSSSKRSPSKPSVARPSSTATSGPTTCC